MPGTASGTKNNAWLQYMRDCAAKYHELHGTQPTKHAKPTHAKPTHTKPTHAKTKRAAGASKEEKEVQKWQDEKAETHRKQAHAHMQRAREHAQKTEQEHLARQRRAATKK